jgi:pyridoxamine 5'-phosphate oxidase
MLAPWRSLLSGAIHRSRSQPHSRYFQLATVNSSGQPTNRTVVFRGFLDDQHNQQFRLTGQLQLITAQELNPDLQKARQATWQNLSDPARSQFSWPAPAQPMADKSAFEVEGNDAANPHDNFCLLLLTPHRIDHLQLSSDPQQRFLYNLQNDQTWMIQAVNP